MHQNIIYHVQVGFIPGMQDWYSIHKSINVIDHIIKMKNNNHMIISIDAEKAFDKFQLLFMIKNPQQSGNRGNILKCNKVHIWQTHCQHHTQWAKTTSVPLKTGKKTVISPFTSLIQQSTGSPSHCNQTRRRNKCHPNWKGRSKTVFNCSWHDTVHTEPQLVHQKTTRTDKWIQQSSRIQN